MTDAQYAAWLADTKAIRLLLAEAVVRISGTETTRYMSTSAYVTTAGETPAHQYHVPVMLANVTVSEQLSLTGEASMSIGEIELDNTSGDLDSWLGDVWVNRPCRLYLGDPRWPRSDFRLVFDGIVADIGSKSRTTLGLKLRDKLQRLNTAIGETKLGGSTTNKDSLLPHAFGEVHNVTPLLTDPAALRYQVHNGLVESIFEVRDNGLPVSVTVDVGTGTFALNQSPDGAITVSAQGSSAGGYANTVSGLVQRLATAYGKVADRFVTADLDTTNLAAFEAAHPQPVGLWVPDRMNVLNACRELAGSLGAQVTMSRTGKMRLQKIDLPARRNMWVNSVNFAGPEYSSGGAIRTANVITAPDGSLTGCGFDDTGASANPSVPVRQWTVTAPRMTVSFYTKTGTATERYFLVYNNNTALGAAGMTFSYGTGSTNGNTDWAVETLPGGWFRLSCTLENLTAGHFYNVYYGRSGAADVGSTATWYMWGAMLNNGYLLPYESTTTQAGPHSYDIYPNNMEEKNLAITTRTEVVSSVKLGYNKNWTMQPGLQTAIPAADKSLFDTEWLTSTQSDATVASVYKLSTEPVQQDTMLLKRTDAAAEATRLLNLRKVPRQVYEFTGFSELFDMELGQTATIYHPRFGLNAGATGMIVSLKTTWVKNRITVGVLV